MAGRGDRGGPLPRLLIEGVAVRPIAEHQLPADRAQQLFGQGKPTPVLYELDGADASTFRGSIATLASGNRFSASVHVYEEDEYRSMRLLVTDDGRAGVAVKDDEIVSAFCRADSRHRGCSEALLATAVAAGGRRLDCFDTALPHLYARAGFVPAARLAWNGDYAPDGWDYGTYARYNSGRPDVVFMTYDQDAVGGDYTPGAGVLVADYDTGTSAASRSSAT